MKCPIINLKNTVCALAVLTALPALAQTQPKDTLLNRTVVVEQEYNPDIMDAQKINVVPRMEEIKVTPREVEYDAKTQPRPALPVEAMDVYAGRELQKDAYRGYLRLGYGNMGNLDARASYLLKISERDNLDVDLRMDGRDGKLYAPNLSDKWNNHHYRTHGRLHYSHRFDNLLMDIAGGAAVSNFNALTHATVARRQKYTSGDAHLGFASTNDEQLLQFTAETNLLFYSRAYNHLAFEKLKETAVRTKADVVGRLNNDGRVGVRADMHNRFYSYKDHKNVTTLLLNPYYEMSDDNYSLHLGVNADLAFGFGQKAYVSPDVKLSYIFSQHYVLYLNAVGGRVANDYRRLETYSPHTELSINQIEDSYEQINATIGLKAGPLPGLWFNVYGGYQKTRKDLFAVRSFRDLKDMTGLIAPYYLTEYALTSAANLYAGIDVNYSYKDVFKLTAHARYRNWDVDETYEDACLMKPEAELGLRMDVAPISKLNVYAGYEYVQRAKNGKQERLDAVNNLHLGADYQLLNNVSVFVKADNVLDKKYMSYLNYMNQGISVMGGASVRF